MSRLTAHLGRKLEGATARLVAPLLHALRRGDLIALAYHGIRHPERFAHQLDILLRHRRTISLTTLLEVLDGKRELPRRSALVTFDDADRSLVDHGIPLLQDRQIPAVAFVAAGFLDGEQPFWWQEVEALMDRGASSAALAGRTVRQAVRHMKEVQDEKRLEILEELRRHHPPSSVRVRHLRCSDLPRLEAVGIDVGSHSLTHPCLPRCTTSKIEHEIGEAHRVLAECLGHEPKAFAYPNGDHDPRVAGALKQCGYRAAFLFDHRVAGSLDHRLAISRLRVGTETPLPRFRSIISGLHPFLHQAVGRQ